MRKYVIFIKNNKSKIIPKESAAHLFIKEMKQKGSRKYHTEAENENDAIKKLNKSSEDHFNSLNEFSGSVLICSAFVIITALIYYFS